MTTAMQERGSHVTATQGLRQPWPRPCTIEVAVGTGVVPSLVCGGRAGGREGGVEGTGRRRWRTGGREGGWCRRDRTASVADGREGGRVVSKGQDGVGGGGREGGVEGTGRRTSCAHRLLQATQTAALPWAAPAHHHRDQTRGHWQQTRVQLC
jgi:hypothetical protein